MEEALESCTSDVNCIGVMNKCNGLSGYGRKCMKFKHEVDFLDQKMETDFIDSDRFCVHRKGIKI